MLNTMLYDQDFGFCMDDAVVFKVEISVCGDLEPCNSSLVDGNDLFGNSSTMSLAHCMKTLFLQGYSTDVDIVVGGYVYVCMYVCIYVCIIVLICTDNFYVPYKILYIH